jgi:hypothetical protein
VIFLDIGEILEKGVHESSVCDLRAYIDFLISTFLSNSHSKFPTIWTFFFNSQLHLAIPFWLFNSLILQYLPHVTHFPKSLPLTHFPQTVPTLLYPSGRSSSPTYFTSTFISNSADCLVYSSTLSGEALCDTLRLVWCVCVRPSLCPPPMVSRYNLRTDFKFCTVVWYHEIQIKFEFQCDQIIGSKVVTVWRLKICETWRGMQIQGKQFLICYTGDELLNTISSKISFLLNPLSKEGTCKVRNEIETKRSETKSNKTKRNEPDRNETKRNEM